MSNLAKAVHPKKIVLKGPPGWVLKYRWLILKVSEKFNQFLTKRGKLHRLTGKSVYYSSHPSVLEP
jgi:hypothetical protein